MNTAILKTDFRGKPFLYKLIYCKEGVYNFLIEEYMNFDEIDVFLFSEELSKFQYLPSSTYKIEFGIFENKDMHTDEVFGAAIITNITEITNG